MVIDVSAWQGQFDWTKYKDRLEAAVIKCGSGSNIKSQDDKQWVRNVSECERLGIPFGVYLYSYAKNEKMAKSEAEHVLRLVKGHALALPIFYDLEESSLQYVARKNFYAFAEAIGNQYRVGLYSGEYYYNSCLTGTAADWLWIAKYGKNDGKQHTKPVLSDGKTVHMWQYTSKLDGGNLDASVILDKSLITGATAAKKTVDELAAEVMDGKWGNGDERKNRLTAAGYDYTAVQNAVNALAKRTAKKTAAEIAKEVIAGKWGNGAARKKKLEAAGYNYAEIQAEVNKLMG